MSAPRLPAPLHTAFALLLAKGLDWREKWAAIRLMRNLQAGLPHRARHHRDEMAGRQSNAVSPAPTFVGTLCIAALNTPAERASAQVLANVLRDSLGGAREASDMLLPQVDLSALFPDPAAKFVASAAARCTSGHRVAALRREADGWRIDDAGPYTHVVLAVAPYHLAALVPELARGVAHFDWEPIVTSYFRYPAGCACRSRCWASTPASRNGCSTAARCAGSTA
jgi:predicted NAD/FAD-binding protein